MAIVTTPAEFIAELTGGGDVNLANDIDFYDDYPEGIDGFDVGEYGAYIYGNGHTIKNLRTKISNPTPIFYSTYNTTIILNDVNFLNLIVQGTHFISMPNGAVLEDDYPVEIYNCKFAGQRSGESFFINCTHVMANRCTFNMPWIGLQATSYEYISLVPWTAAGANSTTDYIADSCRFMEHYGGWTPFYSDYRLSRKKSPWGCFLFKKSGCRIEGDMTIKAGGTSPNNNYCIEVLYHPNALNYVAPYMNVFDVDVTCDGTYTQGTYGYFYGLYVDKLVNSNGNKMTEWKKASDASTSNFFPLIATPAEAQNEQWLYEHGIDVD